MEKKNNDFSETQVMQTLTDADDYDQDLFDTQDYDFEDDLNETSVL